MRDFTIAMYKRLCSAVLAENFTPITVRDYCSGGSLPDGRTVIFRHDVDRRIGMALAMAEIEHDMQIRATYYFRHIPEVFRPDIITKIRDLGHEIGYHYEVLDKAKGNKEEAIRIFEQELSDLRGIAEINTVCMHGNPLASWSNRDLWETYDFRKFGIIGEPYLSIDYQKFCYFSDTGRIWNGDYSVKDVIGGPGSPAARVRSTEEIIALVNSGSLSHLCLLVHPNRWSDDPLLWSQELVWQNIKNIGKKLIKGRA